MPEYIEREALLKEVDNLKKSPWYNDDYGFGTKQARHDGVECVVDLCIKQAPAADVVEVVHGEWIAHGYKWRCSVCNHRLNLDGTPTENGFYFCPNCGAKMDRKGD